MRKKGLSLFLSLLLAVSVTCSAFAAFPDVTSSYDWAKDAIDTLVNNKIVEGYPDGTFKPGNNITKQEAITLFARTMGSSAATNSPVVAVAYDNAKSVLAKYDSYALENAAYLMYKKVLTEDDLSTYLSSANKDKPLKRYEAATLIAKCLGGDVWLKSNPEINVTFTDSADIPSSALGYVHYATELGIIQGMDHNTFVPMGDVTRAQISVMLQRFLSLMQFTYEKGMIANVDTTNSTVSIKKSDGESIAYNIGKGISIMIDGEQSPLNSLSVGMEAVITYSEGDLYSIDAVSFKSDDSLEGVYRGKTTTSTSATVKISGIDESASDAQTYSLADDVVVRYKGGSGSLADFSVGDYVSVELKNGKIVTISGEPKTTTISGAVIESIEFDPEVVIKVRTKDNEVMTLDFKNGATIKKNNAISAFTALAVGDKVEITLEYRKVASLSATGASKDVEGTIEEITISKTASSLKIKKGDTVNTYSLNRDATITLDGAAATVYDLRLGYSVKVTTSSSSITAIEVKSVSAPMQITGTITVVNTAYGMVKVSSTDANGNVTEEQIFIKDTAKILDSNDNQVKKMKDLEVGMNITVAGSVNLGIFEATSVMILSSSVQ